MSGESLWSPRLAHLRTKDLITEQDILDNSSRLFPMAPWVGLGALMSSRTTLGAFKKRAKQLLKGHDARISFFSMRTLKMLKRFSEIIPGGALDKLGTMEEFGRLQTGEPVEIAWNNIRWKTDSLENLGLIWIGVTAPIQDKANIAFLDELSAVFTEHRFECPITVSVVDPQTIMVVSNISFSRHDAEHSRRARSLYDRVGELVDQYGYAFYRKSSMMKNDLCPPLHRYLKQAFDPNDLIAPGKYGIHSHSV